MDVTIDGARLFYLPVGDPSNHPLIVLHGGPGLDHTEMHPWLDSLADNFYLLYIDLRGQGRSERVDPASLTLEVFANDISGLAAALGLDRYALLGHSFGSFITLAHAIESGEATHYIISSGTASFRKTLPEIEQNLAIFEPVELRDAVTQSWALEPAAKTQEDVARIMDMQLPFHFARIDSDAYRRYREEDDRAIYAPEVLAYFAGADYPIEYEDRLGEIGRPTLILAGEHDRTCTPRAARDMQAGIAGSTLVVIPDAGHMTYVEQPEIYFRAVREFFGSEVLVSA